MAGKVQVAKFSSLRDINDNNYGGSTFLEHPPGKWNMEEDEVLDRLSDASYKNRVEILEQLAITVRRNGGRLPYADRLPIFEGLAMAMSPESNWEVRHKCIQLLNEIIPHFGDDLDVCMKVVLPNLIPNIGDKVSVRRAVIQNLHLYMKHTKDVPGLLHAITQLGLENDDIKVRRETVNAIPLIFTREFAGENFFEVTQSLAKKLLETSAEDNLRESSILTLKKIEDLVGEAEFDSYLQRLTPGLRRYYMQVTGRMDENGYQDTPRPVYNLYGDSAVLGIRQIDDRNDSPISERSSVYQDSYEFGIIPSHVMNHINDHDNFRTRAQGVEELKGIMRDLSNAKTASDLLPHMVPYISFLNNLLDDSNFKITTVTLEILSLLVEKVGKNISKYLRPLVSLLTKRMGDNKIVIRTAVMRVVVKMMQSYSPQPVLDTLAENLRHKNSRMRQETINFIIAALLRFPSYEFELSEICAYVAPLLIDTKRHVRHAAMDAVAVLAQAMGAGRLHPLVSAVDQVELNLDGEGLMSAVQARLARRQLPKLSSDNLVEYAFPIPSSATQRSGGNGTISGADIDWIMAVGSGSGSARTARGIETDYESLSLNSSARSTPAVPEAPTPAPRRFMSAGRGRNKLPWEEERDERMKAYDTLPGSAPAQGFEDVPPKPKTMWASDTESSPEPRRVPRRRITVVGINQVDDPPDTGSYSQLYQQKKLRIKQQGITSRSSSFGAGESDVKENGFTKSELKTPRSFLEPISVDSSAPPSEDGKPDEDEASAIPRKATLARGSATRRLSPKVPPISSSDKFSTPREDDSDTSSLPLDGDNQSEMNQSLRRIRNSASKKKAEKFFENLEKQGSRGSLDSSSQQDSSISSSSSRDDSKKKASKQDSPFEAKPKLVRTGSLKKKEFGEPDDAKTVQSDFSPMSGVTFRSKPTSDVKIVGKGYSEESVLVESKPLVNRGARDRRRPAKGTLLSPLGVASSNSHGAVELDDDRLPGQDNIALVGKGMFDTQPALATDYPVQAGQDRLERRPFRAEGRSLQQGVIGVKMKNNPDDDHHEDEGDEEFATNSMAKTLRDRIAQKQEEAESKRIERERKLQEERERARKERERQQQEKEERLKKERERQQEKLKRLSTTDNFVLESLAISGSNTTAAPAPIPVAAAPPPVAKATPPKPPPPAITPRKKIKAVNEPVSSHPMSAGSHSPTEETADKDNIEDSQPFKDPEPHHKDALKKIADDDWEVKIEAMNTVRRLAMHHPNFMTGQVLHPVVIALINEVKNLRSAVSRVAIMTLGEMYQNLKKNMEPDLDMTTKILLAKSGESNDFIRQVVDMALGHMVDNVTPQRALLALISGGAMHKNPAVRRTTAMFLVDVVEKMGPGRILSGIKDITDRVLPTAAQFALDGAQETRYYGKKILSMLMSHQDFDKMLTKYLPANTLRSVQDVVENLKLKGLGDLPSETSSAKSRRSGHGSRAGSSVRSSSANRIPSDSSNATPTTRRRPVKRMDDATMEEIKGMITQMADSDWRVRCKGIDAFQEMCEMSPDVVASNIIKIFDKFLPRLQDSNSKVNVHALTVMQQVLPLLKDHMGGVINMAIGNIAPNLASKNTEIFNLASDILNLIMDTLDAPMLVQPFAHQACMASARSKAFMVERVTDLADRVYPRKQKPVVLHVLPLLWQLMGTTNPSGAGVHGNSADLKTATAELARTLHHHMGQTLFDRAAASESGMNPRQLQLLQDIINHAA